MAGDLISSVVRLTLISPLCYVTYSGKASEITTSALFWSVVAGLSRGALLRQGRRAMPAAPQLRKQLPALSSLSPSRSPRAAAEMSRPGLFPQKFLPLLMWDCGTLGSFPL